MRLNRAIRCPRIIECQFFSFMPPIASAKRLQVQTRQRVRSPLNGARTVLYAGAACVKFQVDCLGVGIKIELDHGPINAPQMVMSALPPKADMCVANRDVRFGPKADIAAFIRSPHLRRRSTPMG